jgi:hypothetical protein
VLYCIERITDRTGRDREDGRNPQRIGREGALLEAEVGYPMRLAYITPDVGTLVTSRVNHIKRYGRELVVKTLNSIYHLREVEEENA